MIGVTRGCEHNRQNSRGRAHGVHVRGRAPETTERAVGLVLAFAPCVVGLERISETSRRAELDALKQKNAQPLAGRGCTGA